MRPPLWTVVLSVNLSFQIQGCAFLKEREIWAARFTVAPRSVTLSEALANHLPDAWTEGAGSARMTKPSPPWEPPGPCSYLEPDFQQSLSLWASLMLGASPTQPCRRIEKKTYIRFSEFLSVEGGSHGTAQRKYGFSCVFL